MHTLQIQRYWELERSLQIIEFKEFPCQRVTIICVILSQLLLPALLSNKYTVNIYLQWQLEWPYNQQTLHLTDNGHCSVTREYFWPFHHNHLLHECIALEPCNVYIFKKNEKYNFLDLNCYFEGKKTEARMSKVFSRLCGKLEAESGLWLLVKSYSALHTMCVSHCPRPGDTAVTKKKWDFYLQRAYTPAANKDITYKQSQSVVNSIIRVEIRCAFLSSNFQVGKKKFPCIYFSHGHLDRVSS